MQLTYYIAGEPVETVPAFVPPAIGSHVTYEQASGLRQRYVVVDVDAQRKVRGQEYYGIPGQDAGVVRVILEPAREGEVSA